MLADMGRRPLPGKRVYIRERGDRWQIEIRDGDARAFRSVSSKAEALETRDEIRRETAGWSSESVHAMIDRYEKHLRRKGNRESSIATTLHRLRTLPDVPLGGLTLTKARAWYRHRQQLQTDTHRNELAEAKTFGRWLVKQGFAKRSPFEGIDPVGKRQRGKAQLRPGEAAKLADLALELGTDQAVGVLLALMLGLRAGEIVALRVRDVDAHTRRVYVDRGKTDAAERAVEVPAVLWPLLERRLEGEPGDWLLGRHWRDWVCKNTRRLCAAAGVPVVTAHGLRGTHSSLAEAAGVSGHAVAAQLGHESERTTRAHYTRAEVRRKARQRKAVKVLKGGKR